jgi:hypothetical protein
LKLWHTRYQSLLQLTWQNDKQKRKNQCTQKISIWLQYLQQILTAWNLLEDWWNCDTTAHYWLAGNQMAPKCMARHHVLLERYIWATHHQVWWHCLAVHQMLRHNLIGYYGLANRGFFPLKVKVWSVIHKMR